MQVPDHHEGFKAMALHVHYRPAMCDPFVSLELKIANTWKLLSPERARPGAAVHRKEGLPGHQGLFICRNLTPQDPLTAMLRSTWPIPIFN